MASAAFLGRESFAFAASLSSFSLLESLESLESLDEEVLLESLDEESSAFAASSSTFRLFGGDSVG